MTTTSLRWVLLAAATVGAIGCGGGGGVERSGTGGSTTITTGLCDDSQMAGRMDVPAGVTPTVGRPAFPPVIGATVHQSVAPPAISGGTLRILPDGMTAVAADPDRDQVYVVDLGARSVRAVVPLAAGDEPGRVVADAAGRAHVALRRGGALVTIDTASGALLARRAVCAAPRGAAYDAANDLVHVACADGLLVSLPAAGGDAVRTLTLAPDLRDVVVDGPRLRVSRFRSAEVLTVEADGSVPDRVLAPAFRSFATRSGGLFTAGVAWKMEAMPEGGVMMLHQRGVVDEVMPAPGGYGSFDPCGAIVHPAVTAIDADGAMRSGPALAGMVLAVDMAISRDGKRVAIVSAGNATNQIPGDTGPDLPRVFLTDVDDVTDTTIGCQSDGMHGPCPATFGSSTRSPQSPDGGAPSEPVADLAPIPPEMTGTGGATGVSSDPTCGVPDPEVPPQVGQPIAVAFYGADQVVVQSREPAMLAFADGRNVTLSTTSREDTGHLVFHANAGGFLACASCHAEGNDDGRTWNFTCEGPRRTQSLQTGLRGTEPFHWSGDQPDFSHLMSDVFVGRMSGPVLPADQGDALLAWIDAQPRPARPAPTDAAAVERGRAIFTDTRHAACAACHLPSANFTNHVTVDVGTGGAFQVPSLVGIGGRGPYMHNGCAKTLRDRLTDASCGGGDNHGKTSDLTSAQISDLLAFLESI
jgi:mono/diheme cytochrome c family protein